MHCSECSRRLCRSQSLLSALTFRGMIWMMQLRESKGRRVSGIVRTPGCHGIDQTQPRSGRSLPHQRYRHRRTLPLADKLPVPNSALPRFLRTGAAHRRFLPSSGIDPLRTERTHPSPPRLLSVSPAIIPSNPNMSEDALEILFSALTSTLTDFTFRILEYSTF
jgi:hypothetical protein